MKRRDLFSKAILASFVLFMLGGSPGLAANSNVNLSIHLNQSKFQPGDTMEFYTGLDIKGLLKIKSDIYLSLEIPDGTKFYMNSGMQFAGPNQAIPAVKDWQIIDIPDTRIFNIPIPSGIPVGNYKWELTLTTPDGDINNSNNIIASDAAPFLFSEKDEGPSTPSENNGSLTLKGNSQFYKKGEIMQLSLGADLDSFGSQKADVYLMVTFPDGSKHYMKPDLSGVEESGRPEPVIKDLQLGGKVPSTPFFNFEIGEDMPEGEYKWEIALVKPGGSLGTPANIIGRAVYAGRVIPDVEQEGDCPPISSIAACFPPNFPSPESTIYRNVGGYSVAVIQPEYNPCNYDVLDTEEDYAAFQDACAAKEEACAENDYPTLTKCENQQYREEGCGLAFEGYSIYGCDKLEETCNGTEKAACEDVLVDNTIPVRCDIDDLDKLTAFGDKCYANFCADAPTLDQCLDFTYRVNAYCATGTPAARQDDTPLPTTAQSPDNNPQNQQAPSSDSVVLVDPNFAQKFDDACNSTITARENLCIELQNKPMPSVFGGDITALQFYSYYLKPFIGFDPIESIPRFYPPEIYKLCTIGHSEFPAERVPPIYPLYVESMFRGLEEIINPVVEYEFLVGLNEAAQLNQSMFDQQAMNDLGTLQGAMLGEAALGAQQLMSGFNEAAAADEGDMSSIPGVDMSAQLAGVYLNTGMAAKVPANIMQPRVSEDLYTPQTMQKSYKAAPSVTKPANTNIKPVSQGTTGLNLDIKIENTIPTNPGAGLSADWTPENAVLHAKINTYFNHPQAAEINKRISMSDLDDIDDTRVDSCNEYVYNKYFSYSILQDKAIKTGNMLDVVRFAYAEGIYPYSLGLAATEGLGVVRKNQSESYDYHLGRTKFICPTQMIPGSTIDPSLVDYSDVKISSLDMSSLQIPALGTTLYKAIQPVTVKSPQPVTVKPPVTTIDVKPVDKPDIEETGCYIEHNPLNRDGIERSKNFFIEVLQKLADYNADHAGLASEMGFQPTSSNGGGDIKALMDTKEISGQTSVLDLTVNENWQYYKERVAALPNSFKDSDFQDYRDYRTRVLDLLILRARVEKTLAESSNLQFQDEKSTTANQRIVNNANTYVGALYVLTHLTTATPNEKEIINGELNKAIVTDLPPVIEDSSHLITDIISPSAISSIKAPVYGANAKVISQVQPVTAGNISATPVSIVSIPTIEIKPPDYSKLTPADINPVQHQSIDSTVAKNLMNEIDTELIKVLAEIYQNNAECFGTAESACDWLPEHFVERINNLVPEATLNHDYEECKVYTEDHPFYTLDDYVFDIDQAVKDAGLTSSQVCNALDATSQDEKNPSESMSDSQYCHYLRSGAHDYTADTEALEKFYPDLEFWNATAGPVSYYLMFKDNGVVDNELYKAYKSSNQLFLGVSYSDYFETGSKWLGCNAGYGIGAGIGGLSNFFSAATDNDPNTNMDVNDIKASLFGHAYFNGKLLTINIPVISATGFASTQEGFKNNPTSFMPAIDSHVLDDAKGHIGTNNLYTELSILGYDIYKNDFKAYDYGAKDSWGQEWNLLDYTFYAIVPIRITVDAGVQAGYEFHATLMNFENGHNDLILVTFGPEAGAYTRMTAGVGFDAGILSAIAGIEGYLDLLKFQLPLYISLTAENRTVDINDIAFTAPAIVFNNSFKYAISFGSGYIGLTAKVKLDLGFWSTTKSYRKILFDFRDTPLWKNEHTIFSLDGEYGIADLLKGYAFLEQ